MLKSAPQTTQAEYTEANNRGQKAKNLFPGTKPVTDQTMKDIVKALKQEELHMAYPDKEEPGKPDFYKACWDAIPDALFAQTFEKGAFIDDLWKTAIESRKAQSTVPCW